MGMVQVVMFFPIQPDKCGDCASEVRRHLMGMAYRFAPPQARDAIYVRANPFFMSWKPPEAHCDDIDVVAHGDEILREAVNHLAAPASQWREFIAQRQ